MNCVYIACYFLFQVHLSPGSCTSFTFFFYIICQNEVLPVTHSFTCLPALFYLFFTTAVQYKKNSRPSFRKAGAFILKMTIAFLYLADYTIP